jgi:predicted RNase H-like HicB family nuclease
MKLHVMIEQDEAGYYVAEVPALPGCLSQGRTKEEALANVTEAITGWLETMEAKREWNPTQTVEVLV